MICITVTESDGEYISVESNGHADYAEKGQDIICAAVSALIVNTVNSVETLTEDLIISAVSYTHLQRQPDYAGC